MIATLKWLIAAALAILLAAGFHLDTEDRSLERAQADEQLLAQADARAERRRQIAITAQCMKERGPNARAIETPDGFRCTDKRGRNSHWMVAGTP